MAHKFAKGGWNPVKHPGSETRRAQEHGRSLHEQAEVDSHNPNKRIRGKGVFALNAQEHKFKHKVGKRKKGGIHKIGMSTIGGRKRTARKRA